MNASKRTFAALTILAIGGLAVQTTQAEMLFDSPQTTDEALLDMAIDAEAPQAAEQLSSFQKDIDQLLSESLNSVEHVRLAAQTEIQPHFNFPIESKLKLINELIAVLEHESDTFYPADPQLTQFDDSMFTDSVPTQANSSVFDLTRSPGAVDTGTEPAMSFAKPTSDARLLVIALCG